MLYIHAHVLEAAINEAYQLEEYSLTDHFLRTRDYADGALYSFRAAVWNNRQIHEWLDLWAGDIEHFVENHTGVTISDILSIMATFALIPSGVYIVSFE